MSPAEEGREGDLDPSKKTGWLLRAWLLSCAFLCCVSKPGQSPHLQWILHQAKRSKQNTPCCGFWESKVMNQNQLKGSQICSGKPRPWLWEPRAEERSNHLFPLWDSLLELSRAKIRYLRTAASCSGVQLFLRGLPGLSPTPHKTYFLQKVPGHAMRAPWHAVS